MSVGRIKSGALMAVASLVVASVAMAQATQQTRERQLQRSGVQSQTERADTPSASQRTPAGERRTAGYRAGGEAMQSQELDKYLATCLLVKNKGEIELSQFGLQQAQSPQVKQFAERMVQEHQQLAKQLAELAGHQAEAQANRQSVGATGQTDRPRTATTTQPAAAPRSDTPGAGAQDILHQLASINREITDRCVELTKNKLQDKQGLEFDKAFIGCQIGEHIGMLASLQVVQQRASGELAQIAQQAEQKVQMHLQEADQLMRQLEMREGQTNQ